jgi:hypothetical protein
MWPLYCFGPPLGERRSPGLHTTQCGAAMGGLAGVMEPVSCSNRHPRFVWTVSCSVWRAWSI